MSVDLFDSARRIRNEIAKAVVGQGALVEEILIALFSGGHVLLEGPPGLAKTLLFRALARTIGGGFKRIQFTPDLMPGDIVGTNVFNMKTGEFTLRKGPVFADVVLADEINRTPPKTQAALLEAMQERQVTIDGETHRLPPAFFVCGTQNPIEYEGAYPLPEAQLDRFMLKVLVDYPRREAEINILRRAHGGENPLDPLEALELETVLTPEAVLEARKSVASAAIEEKIFNYIVEIAACTRSHPFAALGASPRASVALLLCSRTAAVLSGRDFVTPDDVKRMAPPVLRHRLLLKPEALIEGRSADDLIADVLGAVEVPR